MDLYTIDASQEYISWLTVLVYFVNSMERILERYERYSYAERQLAPNDQEPNVQLHLFCIYLIFSCLKSSQSRFKVQKKKVLTLERHTHRICTIHVFVRCIRSCKNFQHNLVTLLFLMQIKNQLPVATVRKLMLSPVSGKLDSRTCKVEG